MSNEEPTSGHRDVCLVGTPKRDTLGEIRHVFLVSKKTLFFFWGWWCGCSTLVGPGVPGLVFCLWTNGDAALDSCAQFLAVAEHKLILARAWSVIGKADRHSVWAPACQDQLSGGHSGWGLP